MLITLITNDMEKLYYECYHADAPFFYLHGEDGELRRFQKLEKNVFPWIYVEEELLLTITHSGRRIKFLKHAAKILFRFWENSTPDVSEHIDRYAKYVLRTDDLSEFKNVIQKESEGEE